MDLREILLDSHRGCGYSDPFRTQDDATKYVLNDGGRICSFLDELDQTSSSWRRVEQWREASDVIRTGCYIMYLPSKLTLDPIDQRVQDELYCHFLIMTKQDFESSCNPFTARYKGQYFIKGASGVSYNVGDLIKKAIVNLQKEDAPMIPQALDLVVTRAASELRRIIEIKRDYYWSDVYDGLKSALGRILERHELLQSWYQSSEKSLSSHG